MVYVITACFIMLDLVTGIIKGLKSKTFSSSVMREGLFHKGGSILLIVFGVLVDYAQTLIDLGVNVPFAIAICTYIVLMEIGSIIENLGKINPSIVPSVIAKYFTKLKEGSK